jgi:hypothetical protein
MIPAAMRQKYPDEMTIILQHEFWDLAVNGEGFEVSLSFSRKPERLTIPFAAVTGFSDPSVPTFGFKFMVPDVMDAGGVTPPAGLKPVAKEAAEAATPTKRTPSPSPTKALGSAKIAEPAANVAASKASEKSDAAKVVSIDAFRKK